MKFVEEMSAVEAQDLLAHFETARLDILTQRRQALLGDAARLTLLADRAAAEAARKPGAAPLEALDDQVPFWVNTARYDVLLQEIMACTNSPDEESARARLAQAAVA